MASNSNLKHHGLQCHHIDPIVDVSSLLDGRTTPCDFLDSVEHVSTIFAIVRALVSQKKLPDDARQSLYELVVHRCSPKIVNHIQLGSRVWRRDPLNVILGWSHVTENVQGFECAMKIDDTGIRDILRERLKSEGGINTTDPVIRVTGEMLPSVLAELLRARETTTKAFAGANIDQQALEQATISLQLWEQIVSSKLLTKIQSKGGIELERLFTTNGMQEHVSRELGMEELEEDVESIRSPGGLRSVIKYLELQSSCIAALDSLFKLKRRIDPSILPSIWLISRQSIGSHTMTRSFQHPLLLPVPNEQEVEDTHPHELKLHSTHHEAILASILYSGHSGHNMFGLPEDVYNQAQVIAMAREAPIGAARDLCWCCFRMLQHMHSAGGPMIVASDTHSTILPWTAPPGIPEETLVATRTELERISRMTRSVPRISREPQPDRHMSVVE